MIDIPAHRGPAVSADRVSLKTLCEPVDAPRLGNSCIKFYNYLEKPKPKKRHKLKAGYLSDWSAVKTRQVKF